MSKEKRLGRGLEALLGRPVESTLEPHTLGIVRGDDPEAISRDGDGQKWLDVASIVANPYQPRQQFDEAEIADLCDSIRTHGFLQPIVVRQVEDQFQIIAGERRFRAALLANMQTVPVQVREVADREMAELAIVENVQRKDLNPLEKAASFQRYLQEYGCTQEELAVRVSIDRSTVANLIRLLELPEHVKQMVVNGDLSQGHARALLPLGDEEEQKQFAAQIKRESLSVRATEQLIQDHIHRADAEPFAVVSPEGMVSAPKPSRSEHQQQLEEQLRLALGTKVDIRQTAKGRGRITLHFNNLQEFDRLKAILCGSEEQFRDAG
ncbi:MAG: ParB/RepB/Spo0J family partition protein [Planctomycetales bacterium]|nr:ParB/RepB/Spo0J family partition protein [Planctomycetales bacterium]